MRLIFILFLMLGCNVNAEDTTFYNVKYLSNYDGDTIRVDLDCDEEIFCKNVPVRVKGIDTPEMKGKCQEEKDDAVVAKILTEKFLSTGDIVLWNCQRGKYFRLVCDIMVDGEDLGTMLLEKGLAIEYGGGTKKEWCLNGEEIKF